MDCAEPQALVDSIMMGVWGNRNRLVQALRMGLLGDALAEAEMAVLVVKERVVLGTANDLEVGTIEVWAGPACRGFDVTAIERQIQVRYMDSISVHCSMLRV